MFEPLRSAKSKNLILVRHSIPKIDPNLAASEWQLSEEGRLLCDALCVKLAPYQPEAIATSYEPKAVETAKILAHKLGLPFERYRGLHEHERPKGTFTTQEQFESKLAEFFTHPRQLVYGLETANQAHQRFAQGIDQLLTRYSGKNLLVITHGTVITLWAANRAGLDPFPFWQQLGIPSFVVISRPELEIAAVVEKVA